jgi:hypothetical protein
MMADNRRIPAYWWYWLARIALPLCYLLLVASVGWASSASLSGQSSASSILDTDTPTSTPTSTATCCNNITATASAFCISYYGWGFGYAFDNYCGHPVIGSGALSWEARRSDGTWVDLGPYQTFDNRSFQSGHSQEAWELDYYVLPPDYTDWRTRLHLIGDCWEINVVSASHYICYHGLPPTLTYTPTNTRTYTPTIRPTNTPCPACTPTPTPYGTWATHYIVPEAGAPPSGGTVSVGDRFVLDLSINSGIHTNLTAQQAYITFTNSLLKNARVDQIATSCVLTNSVTVDNTVYDAMLQNEVCNGPGVCNFRGLYTDPGSIAFASGDLDSANCGHGNGCGGTFRVARIGLCAVASGTAILHWQFSPPAPPIRDTEIVDSDSYIVNDRSTYPDYVIHVATPTCGPDGGPDLVANAYWQPQTCTPGLRLSLITQLIGAGPVPPTTMRLTDRSGYFQDYPVPSLSDNGSYTAQFFTWGGGDPPYTLTVDYDNVVIECNEGNNNYIIPYVPATATLCPPPPTSTYTYTPTPTHPPTFTPTFTPQPALRGHLTWQGITQPNIYNEGITGTLTLCSGSVPHSYTTSTDVDGFFTVTTGLPNGTYNWWFKGPKWLATSGTLDPSGELGTQKAGDANNSNYINIEDFRILKVQFGSSGTNLLADFNNDGVVDILDFNLLKVNFGWAGAAPNCSSRR